MFLGLFFSSSHCSPEILKEVCSLKLTRSIFKIKLMFLRTVLPESEKSRIIAKEFLRG